MPLGVAPEVRSVPLSGVAMLHRITCGRVLFLAASAVLLSVAGSASVLAQPSANAKDDGSVLVRQAYEISQKADKVTEYAQVIALCQKGLDAGLPGESLKYARELMSWAHNRRGQVALDAGEFQTAMPDFEAAIKHDPSRWRAWHNRGYCRAAEGDYAHAMEDFDHTIELNPKYNKAYFNRAELHFVLGKLDEAIQDYTKAIHIDPSDSEAYNLRGFAYYRATDFTKAKADYNQALKIDPKNIAALVNRGDLYADFGQYDAAARDYQLAINTDPESDRAYVSAAWMMATCTDQRFRNADLAMQAANKALEIMGDEEHPERFRYLEVLAAAQANAGNFDGAVKTQTKANELAPEEDRDRFAGRLKLYAAKQPYRDTKPAEKTSDATQPSKRTE